MPSKTPNESGDDPVIRLSGQEKQLLIISFLNGNTDAPPFPEKDYAQEELSDMATLYIPGYITLIEDLCGQLCNLETPEQLEKAKEICVERIKRAFPSPQSPRESHDFHRVNAVVSGVAVRLLNRMKEKEAN